jgi:LuxR family maltose regulon positive regulatory protein
VSCPDSRAARAAAAAARLSAVHAVGRQAREPWRSVPGGGETLAPGGSEDGAGGAGVPGGPAAAAVGVPALPRVTFSAPMETKLHAPPLRAEWVERDELVGYLAGVTARLVLVDGPAGFGKTTLVAQWGSSKAESRPFAWVSLDPGDNDPGRLWWHVICSLQRACPQLDAGPALGVLRVQAPDFAGAMLPLLVNALAALTVPVVVVLDDYHALTERSCHDQVAFLLEHLPPAVQLVLMTRADPPLPLARWRVSGELAEVRVRELRFTPAQAGALVAAVAGIELSGPDLADLAGRTEGWPAGVYLAALSLRGHPSPGAFVRQFTGDSRFILDFLAEEVLGRQPDGIRRFLARTSILGRFCAPLCDAVTGSAGAAEVIPIIERENLFVVPLDDTRQWFRYHHLFGQVLRSELARSEPDIVPVLHERASAWHRRSGTADEAIRHARAAGDAAAVIDLIAAHWRGYVDCGQVATVRGWLNSLGDAIVSASAVAVHCAAWAAALSGDQESLRRWLPVVETSEHDGPLPDGARSMQSSAALLKATFGFEGLGPMRDAAAEAVALETDPASPWYSLARAAYAGALYWSGESYAAFEQAQAALSGNGSVAVVRIIGFSFLSLIAADRGNLEEAEQHARSACEVVEGAGPGLAAAPQSCLAYTAAGAALAGRGQLAEARSEFERALRIRRSQPGISPWPTLEILLRLAPVLAETGDRPGAVALLDEARLLLVSSPAGAGAQLARLGPIERRLAARPRGAAVAEPLTAREVAVLRLLSGTLSLREIGEQLYLSQNTIKTHARAIYRKLGVSTRHDAITQAKDAGIL